MARVFEEDAVMTALCLWEACLDFDRQVDEQGNKTPLAEEIGSLWDGYSTFTMRQAMIDIAHDCDVAWEAAVALHGGEYPDSFDFEFCPMFLREQIMNGTIEKVITGQFTKPPVRAG